MCEKCTDCDIEHCNVAAVGHFYPTLYTHWKSALYCVYLFCVYSFFFYSPYMSFPIQSLQIMALGLSYLSESSLLRPGAMIESFSYYYGSCCCRLSDIELALFLYQE